MTFEERKKEMDMEFNQSCKNMDKEFKKGVWQAVIATVAIAGLTGVCFMNALTFIGEEIERNGGARKIVVSAGKGVKGIIKEISEAE